MQVPLKPLSLHERVQELTDAHRESLPMSEIIIKGKFSMSDALQWISNCLPNVPHSTSEHDSGVMQFYYKSSFLHTYLILEIHEGQINVMSDNFSVMAILKDQISADASCRKIGLEIKADFNEDSA